MTDARRVLKEALYEEWGGCCMARLFLNHRCDGTGFDLHEVLVKRNDLPKSRLGFLTDRLNCISVCHATHMAYGQAAWFNRQAARVLVEIHGLEAVLWWLSQVPFTDEPTTLEAIMCAPDPPEDVGYRWLGVPAAHRKQRRSP
jgi:hypothetical protein